MHLPKCVKVADDDEQSRMALLDEGWREVGTLCTYSGSLATEKDERVFPAKPEDVIDLVYAIKWSGRLWRDPEVSNALALAETMRHVKEFKGTIYAIGKPSAFGMFDRERVVLIGTHWMATGLGLASALIKHASPGRITAGTYDDNYPAMAVYYSLGLASTKRERVFHK